MSDPLHHSPADVIRSVLVTLGLTTEPALLPENDLPWPSFTNREPPTPDDCVTVFDTDGVDHGRVMFGGERQSHHGIQIRVRSTYHDSGFKKAREIALSLDSLYDFSVTVPGTQQVGGEDYVVHSVNRVGEVLSLGREVPESKRSVFTVNAMLTLKMIV